MEHSGRERRVSPRFTLDLQCTVSLPHEERDILFPHAALVCRTRDISASGVGLVAPSIYLGYACVVDEGRTLRLALELPGGPVELNATPVHYLRLDRGGDTPSYLVGLRITETPGENLSRYLDYLSRLDAPES